MIYPQPLVKGDKIAIITPASKINPEYVNGACAEIERRGFIPVVSKHCKGEHGSYSGTIENRLEDLKAALGDPDVRAILCSRGGYGVVHLLEHLPNEDFTRDPKWIIGFSDISALHAACGKAGVASIHASMTKHLTERPTDDCSEALFGILTGQFPHYREAGHKYNIPGYATGTIVGGNMAVLTALMSTDYNLLKKDHILFLEDVSEAIYKIERMLYTLRLSGVLESTRALIIGEFTDYKPSVDYNDMFDMIHDMVKPYGIPTAFNFPVGHVDRNLPIIEGATATINITPDTVDLTFAK